MLSLGGKTHILTAKFLDALSNDQIGWSMVILVEVIELNPWIMGELLGRLDNSHREFALDSLDDLCLLLLSYQLSTQVSTREHPCQLSPLLHQ